MSVAVPFRLLKKHGGQLDYGDKLFVKFLVGRSMPNGRKHTGWVQIDDFCGDNGDDAYCFQTMRGKKYPNVDLYLGDWLKSGMKCGPGDPAGSGQELTDVHVGSPGSAWVDNYGGAEKGSGKCGDCAEAKRQQGSKCWAYTPPASSAKWCSKA